MSYVRACSVWAACLLLGNSVALATSQNWDGSGATAYWTNNINWSANGAYPVTDDTATFNATVATYTNVNVAGLSAIKYINFDTTAVGSYTIGAAPVNSQTLVMRNDGNFRNLLSANKIQYFNAAIQLGPTRPAQPTTSKTTARPCPCSCSATFRASPPAARPATNQSR